MGAPSRARLALRVSACESGAALRYAGYGSELAHVAVGSCDDVTGCQAKCKLCAQRVSGGAARVFAAVRPQPLLLVRRGAAWPGSESQRER